MMASISTNTARASSLTMSSARSPACWRRARPRWSCRANLRRRTPMRCPASPHHARWRDRSCRWWRPRSGPINCSAGQARARPRSIRSQREPWSRVKRWPRPPGAPTIMCGRAARLDASSPRPTRRSHPRLRRPRPTTLPQRWLRQRRRSRGSRRPPRRPPHRRRHLHLRLLGGISSDLAPRPVPPPRPRALRSIPARRARRAWSDDPHRSRRATSRADAGSDQVHRIPVSHFSV